MPNADEHAPAAANGGQQPPKPAAALGGLTTGDAMTGTATGLGTFSWVDRTGGQLSAAERRSQLRPHSRSFRRFCLTSTRYAGSHLNIAALQVTGRPASTAVT